MADIVESLFGPTPYQIQQLQNQNLGVAADKYASQDPFQRAAGQLYRGGGMLGGAAAEGLGYVNPMAQQAKLRESVMATGGDLSTAAGLKAKAEQFAAAGDQATAMKLIMLARKQEAEEMDMKLKQAHAKYYEQQGTRTTATAQSQLAAKQAIARNDLTKVGFNMGLSGQELLDFVEAGVQKVTDTWNATTGTTPATPGETSLSPMTKIGSTDRFTQEQKDAMIQDATQRGDMAAVAELEKLPVVAPTPLPKSKAEVAGEVKLAETKAVNDPAALAGGAAAKEAGKTGVEIYTKQFHAADAASKVIPKVDALINQLKTGDVTTGIAADLRLGLARMQALLGGKEAAKNATDSQIADIMMGSEVFPLIQSLGVGARGMDTPAERDFMRKVLTGELSLEKGTLLKMAELRKEAAQRDIDRWDSQVERGDLDKYFQNVGIPKTKFGQPKKPSELSALPPPSQLTGKTVRDTVTGKRYKSDGTKWVLQ